MTKVPRMLLSVFYSYLVKIIAELVMLLRDHVLLNRQHAKVELLKVVRQNKHTANQKGTKDSRSN